MKKTHSFRFSKETSEYLKNIVRESGLTMTDYIEGLIEIEKQSKPSWARAVVIYGGMVGVLDADGYSTVICDSVTGGRIFGCIPDSEADPDEVMKFIKGTRLTKTIDGVTTTEDPSKLVQLVNIRYGVDPAKHILGW